MRGSTNEQNLLAINLSLAANVVLALTRTGVGILGNSPALLADGINSTSDVAYLAIVRAFMHRAREPPDREHPFGHHQLEGIGAVVIGAFVTTTGVAIFWRAIDQVYNLLAGTRFSEGAEPVALWVAVATMGIKIVLFLFTRRVARRTGSVAVTALTRDHRNDIYTIATAVLGIYFGRQGYAWIDPLAASVVALVIFWTGIRILQDSSSDLMTVLPAKAVTDRIREVLSSVPGVEEVEEIRVHRIGLYLLVDAVLGVDGKISVFEGDRIASDAEERLSEQVADIAQISIHCHPARWRDRLGGRGP